MAEVVITVKLKLDWQDRMLFDSDLSHMAYRVGSAIGWHINRYSGETFVGRHTIAKKLDINVKSVDRAITELERRGHLDVTHARGRGNSNTYRPAFREKATATSPLNDEGSAEKATEKSLFLSEEKATNDDGKGDKSDAERRHGSPPNPYQPIESTLKNSTHAQTHEVRSTGSAAPVQASRPQAFEKSRALETGSAREATKPPLANRGALERDLADALMTTEINGWEVLLNLPDQEIENLCRLLRCRVLSRADIANAHLHYMRQRRDETALELMPREGDQWKRFG